MLLPSVKKCVWLYMCIYTEVQTEKRLEGFAQIKC